MNCEWCGEPCELWLCECCNFIRNDRKTQRDDFYWSLEEPDELSQIDIEIEAIERALNNCLFVKEANALKKALNKLVKKRKEYEGGC